MRVYDARGDALINQVPGPSTKPLTRHMAYGVYPQPPTGASTAR